MTIKSRSPALRGDFPTFKRIDIPEGDPLKNSPDAMTTHKLPHHEPHLSDAEANQITRAECAPELIEFIAAAGMKRQVSIAKAALLLEHIIKEANSGDSVCIADQMLIDQWKQDLSDGETVELVSERLYRFLATDRGITLYNFFVKIFAKTSSSMYD